MKKSMKKIAALLLSLILVFSLCAACSSGTSTPTSAPGTNAPADSDGSGDQPSAEKETITLKIGAGHAATATQWTYAMTQYFQPTVAERVAAETNYQIEWTEAWGGSIVKLGEELEGIESGLLDLGLVVYVFEPTKLMVHGMTYRMPFQSPDPVVVSQAAIELFDEFPVFKDTVASYNQIHLGVLVSDDYNLYTTFPVSTVDDINGHKIAGAGANLKWIEGTGAIGVQSNLSEGYTSMQTGVYDGFLNPTVSQYNYKIHEVGPYLLLGNFGAQIVAGIHINTNTYNNLPEDVRQIIEEVALETQTWEAEYTVEDYNAAVKAMEESGDVIITQLTQEEKTRWANMLPNVVGDDLCAELNSNGIDGTAIISAYYEKLQANGYEMVRDWELPAA